MVVISFNIFLEKLNLFFTNFTVQVKKRRAMENFHALANDCFKMTVINNRTSKFNKVIVINLEQVLLVLR
jgi:hypothetical protein